MIRYEKIAESVISSAVKVQLRVELKKHCAKVAKVQAEAWLKANKKLIETAVKVGLEKRFKSELDALIAQSVKAVSIRAPMKRSSYY